MTSRTHFFPILLGVFTFVLIFFFSAFSSAAPDREFPDRELKIQVQKIKDLRQELGAGFDSDVNEVKVSGALLCEPLTNAKTDTKQTSEPCVIKLREFGSNKLFKLKGSTYLSTLIEVGITNLSIRGKLVNPSLIDVGEIVLF